MRTPLKTRRFSSCINSREASHSWRLVVHWGNLTSSLVRLQFFSEWVFCKVCGIVRMQLQRAGDNISISAITDWAESLLARAFVVESGGVLIGRRWASRERRCSMKIYIYMTFFSSPPEKPRSWVVTLFFPGSKTVSSSSFCLLLLFPMHLPTSSVTTMDHCYFCSFDVRLMCLIFLACTTNSLLEDIEVYYKE